MEYSQIAKSAKTEKNRSFLAQKQKNQSKK